MKIIIEQCDLWFYWLIRLFLKQFALYSFVYSLARLKHFNGLNALRWFLLPKITLSPHARAPFQQV